MDGQMEADGRRVDEGDDESGPFETVRPLPLLVVQCSQQTEPCWND